MTDLTAQLGVAPVARATMTERIKPSAAGLRALAVIIVVALLCAGMFIVSGVLANQSGGGEPAVGILIGLGVLLVVCDSVAYRGLTQVVPGEARVVQLFGRYLGTVRNPGLRWVNPFTERRRVSTRIRNYETQLAKVNDADGNPIEIAAVVVWSVEDTARALYDVDDFVRFVDIQTETAVRHVASTHPYDSHEDGQLSLRQNANEITSQLTEEIAARVGSAGVRIIEFPADPALLRPRDRPGDAPPAAGERSGGRPQDHRGGRRGHGRAGARQARGARDRGARPGAQGGDGLQPAGGPVQRAEHPAHRQRRHPVPGLEGSAPVERKSILLRLDPAIHDAVARWAGDELRSSNAQIEFLLRRALAAAGRLPRMPVGCPAGAGRLAVRSSPPLVLGTASDRI